MSQTYPMTREGYESLASLLRELKGIERPKVSRMIEEARGHGDLSENAEYDAAKEKQAHLEGRIADIENKLANSQVIDPASIKEDRVVFGATVTVVDLDTEREKVYQIVGDHESDLKQGKISIQSPIARALIGKRANEFIEFETPGGLRELQLLKIEYK